MLNNIWQKIKLIKTMPVLYASASFSILLVPMFLSIFLPEVIHSMSVTVKTTELKGDLSNTVVNVGIKPPNVGIKEKEAASNRDITKSQRAANLKVGIIRD